jgi:hypothetical protein
MRSDVRNIKLLELWIFFKFGNLGASYRTDDALS